jgi:hypothetical protein
VEGEGKEPLLVGVELEVNVRGFVFDIKSTLVLVGTVDDRDVITAGETFNVTASTFEDDETEGR